MIVLMKPRCSQDQIDHVIELLDEMGCDHFVINGSKQRVVEVLGARDHLDRRRLENAPMVDRVLEKSEPMLAADRSPDTMKSDI